MEFLFFHFPFSLFWGGGGYRIIDFSYFSTVDFIFNPFYIIELVAKLHSELSFCTTERQINTTF